MAVSASGCVRRRLLGPRGVLDDIDEVDAVITGNEVFEDIGVHGPECGVALRNRR